MERDDPFASITELCQVSHSQDSILRHCPFAREVEYRGFNSTPNDQLQNPADIPVASTAIIMVSPPESPKGELPDDRAADLDEVFRTPPEGSPAVEVSDRDHPAGLGCFPDGETVAFDTDCEGGMRAVELGRDSDLGFSELKVKPRLRTEVDSKENQSEKATPSKRGLSLEQQLLEETPWKRLKTSGFESSNLPLVVVEDKCTVESFKPLEKMKSKSSIADKTRDSTEESKLVDQQKHLPSIEAVEESNAGRSQDFRTEVMEPEAEERIIECYSNKNTETNSSRVKKSAEDIDKFRYTGENYPRRLSSPATVNKTVGNAGRELDVGDLLGKDYRELVLDVLKALASGRECGRSEKSIDLMETAKRRGMTFPRPSWWRQEECQVKRRVKEKIVY